MKLSLGIELMVNAVGYGLVDLDSMDIIDYGVRIFEPYKSNNIERRNFRHQRRINRRAHQRVLEMRKLINSSIINLDKFTPLNNICEIKCKGLNSRLSKNELANILINYSKHRGLESFELDENTYKILNNNKKILRDNNLFICEYQFKYLNKGYRGLENAFLTEDYLKEIDKILSNQDLDEIIIKKIKSIISRRRKYDEGPGDINNPSIYGRFRNEYDENGNKIIHDLIEERRGKCLINNDLPRFPKESYTSNLFDLLSFLNKNCSNIDKTKKIELIEYLKENSLSSLSDININNMEYKPFQALKKFRKILPNCSYEFIDECSVVLTKKVRPLDRRLDVIECLKNNNIEFDDNILDKICNLKGFNSYHSLSMDTMKKYIDKMLDSNLTYEDIINDCSIFYNLDKIPLNLRRGYNEMDKVISLIKRKYKDIDHIVVNSNIDKSINENKLAFNKIKIKDNYINKNDEEICSLYNFDINKLSSEDKIKLRLYFEQKGIGIYSNKEIDLTKLLTDEYKIDYIIPYSISFDDSLNNKIIDSSNIIDNKDWLTPYEAILNNKTSYKSFEDFEEIIKSTSLNYKKKEYLINKDIFNNFKSIEGFYNKNMVDCSININLFIKSLNCNAIAIKNKQISFFKNKIGHINLDYNYYISYAIDALVMAGLFKNELFINSYNNIFSKDALTPFIDVNYINYLKKVKNVYEENINNFNICRYSYKKDQKPNRVLSDDMIKSTRIYNEKEYVIKKYRNIYKEEGKSLTKMFSNGKSKNLLMYDNDYKTYQILEDCYNKYKLDEHGNKVDNVFERYYKVTGMRLRKYSKKGNGPEIIQVKYKANVINQCIDISNKYKANNKRVVLLGTTSFRTDFYKNENGFYQIITVKNYLVRSKNNSYYIDENKYLEMLEAKNLSINDFCFSLYRNDIFILNKNGTNNYYRFIATNNEVKNQIECRKINIQNINLGGSVDRIMPVIGKDVLEIIKLEISPIGIYKKVYNEKLKLKL